MEEKQAPTRPYLESLTTSDLIKLADNAGIDIPPALDRIFIIEELLEAYSLDEEELPQEPEMMDTILVESAPLPKQYNITFIEVMIRDPLWAFVFWEVKAQEKEQFDKIEDFDGYYLKVSPIEQQLPPFTVPVGNEDTAWYLNFNPDAFESYRPDGLDYSPDYHRSYDHRNEGLKLEQKLYKVNLCASIGGEETVLAVSNTVKLPGLPEMPSPADKKESGGFLANPLIRLSGYGDFSVVRKNERAFRSKRSASLS